MSLLVRDLFILMDSAVIWIYFKNSQPPISLTACFSIQGHIGHYTTKFTETELDFFLKYLLRAIYVDIAAVKVSLVIISSSTSSSSSSSGGSGGNGSGSYSTSSCGSSSRILTWTGK